MDAQTWEVIVRVAALILSLIGGVYTVPVVNWIKDVVGADKRWAQLITAVVATLVATLTLLVQGQIAPETLTLEGAGQLFVAVLVASQAEYRRLKDRAPAG